LGRLSTGQMRERNHGQDRKEESKAGAQGEGEDCREAFGQRPPQDNGEAFDREALDRQVEGSSSPRRLTADVDTDVHDRPGDLSWSPADPFLSAASGLPARPGVPACRSSAAALRSPARSPCGSQRSSHQAPQARDERTFSNSSNRIADASQNNRAECAERRFLKFCTNSDILQNRPIKYPNPSHNRPEMPKTVDMQQHRGLKTPYFVMKFSVPYQQIRLDCSSSRSSN
jgi:hypothetical protein